MFRVLRLIKQMQLYRDGTAQRQTSTVQLLSVTISKGFPLYIVQTAVLTNVLLHKYNIHLRYVSSKTRKINIKITF